MLISGEFETALGGEDQSTVVEGDRPPFDRCPIPTQVSVVDDGIGEVLDHDADLRRGTTGSGPHRDDLVLELNGLPARGYASHGESISYALALRLASIELLRTETRSGDPILILDDVFAELDEGRRDRLAQLISGNEQVFITAADMADVPTGLKMTQFDVLAGVVQAHE